MKRLKISLAVVLLSFNLNQFTGMMHDAQNLRSYNGKSIKAFIGFVDLIEGAESLISERNHDPILGVQRLMEGVTSLIEARINDLPVNGIEQSNLVEIINEFKNQINDLVNNRQIKASLDTNADPEAGRKKLMEGLAAILYNAVYMLIDPKSMSNCLINILNGIYKVVATVLADDKIDYNDWRRLLEALASIFNLSNNRLVLKS